MLREIFSGWFLVNIAAPLALPILGLLALKLLPLPSPPATLQVMTTVKDGQLCWAVIAMCAATIYELWTAIEGNKHLPAWEGFAIAATIVIMLPAMLLASGGAVFSTPLISAGSPSSRPNRHVGWILHYKVFCASVILTILAASILTSAHFAIE